jgi:hypothetical protein
MLGTDIRTTELRSLLGYSRGTTLFRRRLTWGIIQVESKETRIKGFVSLAVMVRVLLSQRLDAPRSGRKHVVCRR